MINIKECNTIKNKNDFEQVTDFGNLYKAYKKSKSGKGFSKSSQKFQVAALDGIHQIKRRLETKTYEIGKYNEFIIYEPKERIIKAGTFIDKIVQHSLCDNALNIKRDSSDKNYGDDCQIAPTITGENYQELTDKIEKYLEELMKTINKNYCECPKCNGCGIVEVE